MQKLCNINGTYVNIDNYVIIIEKVLKCIEAIFF